MNDYTPEFGRRRLEPTPAAAFFDRRAFVRAGIAAGIAPCLPMALPMAAARADEPPAPQVPRAARPPHLIPPFERPGVFPAKRNEVYALPAGIDPRGTEQLVAARHNNFYEFLPGRGGDVWPRAKKFEVEPWTVEIVGACRKPMKLDLDDLFKLPHEERLYHFRCVERWAMNVPWSGFTLRSLLEKVEPLPEAKYVRFESAGRPEQMPGLRTERHYPWPYHEALRIDEAMNELTMVVTGVYGQPLLKQHGAPVRIVVPWKYGYKNPKSIVKIELVKDEPSTFWQVQPHEYGFISNVNPNIPHPRWSQARSYWIDRQDEWFETPLFNGYGKWVASMYGDEPKTPQEPLRPGQVAR